MQTYVFRVVVEPDEDRWQAHCPALAKYAADTWGYTKEEALQNIKEVIELVLEEMAEDNEPIPQESEDGTPISHELRIAVSV